MRLQIALSSQQLTIRMVRLLAFAISFILLSDVVLGQFNMPQQDSSSVKSPSRLERQATSNTRNLSGEKTQSGQAGEIGRANNGNPQAVQFQVTSTQYKALKYFITGGCVTLIFVLIGSMLRLSGSEPVSDNAPAPSAGYHPHYPAFTSAGFGFQAIPTEVSAANQAAAVGVKSASGSESGVASQASGANAAGIPLPPTALGWPISYIPTLPIGVPVPVQSDVFAAGSHPAATTGRSETGAAQPANSSSEIDEVGLEGSEATQQPADISSTEAAEDFQVVDSSTCLEGDRSDAMSDEDVSVEETLLQHLEKLQDDASRDGTIFDSENHDVLNADGSELEGENLDQIEVAESREYQDAVMPGVELYDPDEIRDPIAEDLASLPVETYGEEIQFDTGSESEPEGKEESNAAEDPPEHDQVGTPIQPVESNGKAIQQTPKAENAEPSTMEQGEHRGRSMSIFDSIVANTIEVKSLAS